MAKFDPQLYRNKLVVIDNSVMLKPFLKEESGELIEELFKMHMAKELTLMAPRLIEYEFLNVLARSVIEENVHSILETFRLIQLAYFDLDPSSVDEAVEKVCKNPKLSYYDAAYHALAKSMGATFLTADERYYEIMKCEGNIALLA